mmetsp:Transcript_11795/g.19972  ORF Transcript_11795/g.19972 Transcript_11795/m.19972 type:complete len:95 (+) Transcript_11795:109-393(+)
MRDHNKHVWPAAEVFDVFGEFFRKTHTNPILVNASHFSMGHSSIKSPSPPPCDRRHQDVLVSSLVFLLPFGFFSFSGELILVVSSSCHFVSNGL